MTRPPGDRRKENQGPNNCQHYVLRVGSRQAARICALAHARYPHLKQVFVTSRIYGGYATGINGCLNPEPFAYEEGFSLQRLITAQIRQAYGINSPDPYSGQVDYTVAPWVDWGPYLWASGATPRNDGLVWCEGQGGQCNFKNDFRNGDPADQMNFWGDFTHPTADAELKVAGRLVNFITGATVSPWVAPWIQK